MLPWNPHVTPAQPLSCGRALLTPCLAWSTAVETNLAVPYRHHGAGVCQVRRPRPLLEEKEIFVSELETRCSQTARVCPQLSGKTHFLMQCLWNSNYYLCLKKHHYCQSKSESGCWIVEIFYGKLKKKQILLSWLTFSVLGLGATHHNESTLTCKGLAGREKHRSWKYLCQKSTAGQRRWTIKGQLPFHQAERPGHQCGHARQGWYAKTVFLISL